ncbi:MAG TPA: DUF2844 domain-containing protein, partial [Steroidobacteraceae bacterium]
MKHSSRTGKALTIALATVMAGSATLPAFAGLGGDAASVDADVAKMKAQARAAPIAGYTMSEITLPTGTVVPESVSAEGTVFAVTWKGMALPDLSQTLGTYFAEYKAAAAATPHASHHNLTVQQTDLVVRTGGHMRNWYGQAYVPSLLP